MSTAPAEWARAGLDDAAQAGYYDGLRFMLDVHTAAGERVPLIDGGLFDGLHRLAGQYKLSLVASGLGSQLAATLFRTR